MSLIEKKLKKLQPGTRVKLTMKDENKSQFLGLVSDNDFGNSDIFQPPILRLFLCPFGFKIRMA